MSQPPVSENSVGQGDIAAIVAVGASAGGLEAVTSLVKALGDGGGAAFILVQHLDPNHESLLVDLLSGHTTLGVKQAADGMELLPGNIHIIPPGAYLSVTGRHLCLTPPPPRQGGRLAFDFLLTSLARAYGSRVTCVILSGTGTDGTQGLRAVKSAGGLVIVQDPTEAEYDGMPRSAIGTGLVDHVVPIAAMPALIRNRGVPEDTARMAPEGEGLAAIINLLRTHTPYDFTLYKQGTLRRRIDRRMSMAGIGTDGLPDYLDLLRRDPTERDNLAKDMLINVTAFFRDPKVFELLGTTVIPDLIRGRADDNHLRLWVAGCSTGQETYSLAMLFLEQITAAGLTMKLQLFASDVDPDAVATAREGWYPASITENVSAERLARFFVADGGGYRVTQELRAHVVFTVQDVLADPPFSRLDFISCRNLLIYLMPEAQARVLALFHFALRDGGFLLLGGAETVAPAASDRFEIVSKPAHLFRHVGRSRPGDFSFLMSAGDGVRTLPRIGSGPGLSRQAALAELCRQMVMRDYAPAAILINRSHDCLYSLGPTEHYLRVPPGHPTQDLLAMTPPSLSVKLRAAIQRARQEQAKVTIQGGEIRRNGDAMAFNIAVHPLKHEGEELMLVCFIDRAPSAEPSGTADNSSAGQHSSLARELDHTRAELEAAIRNLELAGEEQKAATQETLSINEEYQSANEELLTSKEELQSLNEELTALNSQLQETLDRQRTTSNDLQNVLYSTDVATIFLDPALAIRFFTPATRSLFSILPGDIGRPLADLSSLAADGALFADAQSVLASRVPMEREIEARTGAWYLRRVLPYLTREDQVEGVVITFVDITERRRVAEALRVAKWQADLASQGKSRFLAAASHDLRQPLQTLILLQGILANRARDARDRELLDRVGETIDAMSAMLNALLDINQIEAGVVTTDLSRFPINDLLSRMKQEFSYHAQARSLKLRVVPCSAQVFSDRRLLEQMIRNLLSNALKYTRQGKVLVGCRRRGEGISIEIWDTGIGVPESEQQSIFEEHHQVAPADGKTTNGLGLGLSIVRRLSHLLGHPVRVRSIPGRGSVFAVDILCDPRAPREPSPSPTDGSVMDVALPGNILVVEDDPEVGDLLGLVLREAGHRVLLAIDGASALRQVTAAGFRPDLLLVDFNLPGGMNGLELLSALRRDLHRPVPGLLLTADISTDTLRAIARHNEVQLHKPVNPAVLLRTVQRLLTAPPLVARIAEPDNNTETGVTIHIIDDDALLRDSIQQALEGQGWHLSNHANAEDFLATARAAGKQCLLIDAYLPGMGGIDLLHHLRQTGIMTPAIIMTGSSDVPVAVAAMRAGAADFVEKPVSRAELVNSIKQALEHGNDADKQTAYHTEAAQHLAGLTIRQRQIMEMVLAGHPSKNIAADLGISQRTVENHRAAIMRRTGARSLPALARLALLAEWNGSSGVEKE
jgi:two-component system CheB/CheR fusion protein